MYGALESHFEKEQQDFLVICTCSIPGSPRKQMVDNLKEALHSTRKITALLNLRELYQVGNS